MPDALIHAIEARGYSIDRRHGPNGSRFSRARDIVDGRQLQITEATPAALKAVVNQMHKAEIQLTANGEIASVTCTCQDWRTRGKRLNQPCKHILALAMDVGDIPNLDSPPRRPLRTPCWLVYWW